MTVSLALAVGEEREWWQERKIDPLSLPARYGTKAKNISLQPILQDLGR